MLIIYPKAITQNKCINLTKTEMKNTYIRETPDLEIFNEVGLYLLRQISCS